MNDWIYIGDVKLGMNLEKVIHCDTRDFTIVYDNEEHTFDPKQKSALKLHRKFLDVNQYKMSYYTFESANDIIIWLKQLEEMTGGAGEWRNILLKHGYKEVTGWDLKYIRFFYYEELKVYFAVSNSYQLLDKRIFFKENIDQEVLYHQTKTFSKK